MKQQYCTCGVVASEEFSYCPSCGYGKEEEEKTMLKYVEYLQNQIKRNIPYAMEYKYWKKP